MEVQPIKEILAGMMEAGEEASKTANFSPENSNNQEEKEYTRMITATEAKKLRLVNEDIIPRRCEFCGTKLQATGILMDIPGFRRWIHGPDDYEECKCPGAKKHRAELRKAEEERIQAEKERAYQQKINNMIFESRLGKRFRNRTFKNFIANEKNREAYETAKQYAKEFEKYKKDGTGLLFTGSYGTGKTHLAAAICHELIRNDYQPIFGTMISLLGNIKATYNDEYAKETEQQVLNKYIKCDLLIIDDLGKEKPTDWTLEKLYYVINSRYEDCKPIVITTNYADKLVSRLTYKDNIETAEAIVSRIYEMCVGVMMTWEDYRRL